jgi:hypothetical protein
LWELLEFHEQIVDFLPVFQLILILACKIFLEIFLKILLSLSDFYSCLEFIYESHNNIRDSEHLENNKMVSVLCRCAYFYLFQSKSSFDWVGGG